ncbi:MAG: DUF4297 domain-containing protein [Pseudomonadota bacterium]
MSLARKLITQPQREKGGSLAQERFDYQALWGLALIFSNHERGEDYAVAFEFHDDVLLLDSATEPASVRFYQIKTKERGHWTLTDLFRRPAPKKGQKTADRPLSFMGKLFSGYLAFPDETAEMSFVSNVSLDFANATIAFKDCDSTTFSKFVERLKREHETASLEQASLIQFVKADLSLQDASTHAKGKLHNFIVNSLGDISYSLDSLYRAVVEDCRTRSKYTGEISSFDDLIRFKAITRSDVEKWLSELSTHSTMPDWVEIAAELSANIIQKMRMREEWLIYRAKVLDAGDEAIRSVRREIRNGLLPIIDSGLSLDQFIEAVFPLIKNSASKHLSPYSDNRLRVMILYEVIQYGATGQFQGAHKESADEAS